MPIAEQSRKIRDFGQERQKIESQAKAQSETREPATAKLPKSPVAVQGTDQPGKETGPPAAPKTPDLDKNVTPAAPRRDADPKTPAGRDGDQPTRPRGPQTGKKPGERDPGTPPDGKPEPGPGTKPAPKAEPRPAPDTKPEPKPVPKAEPKP